MVQNQLLLSLVAFIVSFSLSLLVNRDVRTAAITGSLAVPASFSALVIANRQQRTRQKHTSMALKMEVRQLEKWKIQLFHSVQAIAAEYQRTQNYLNYQRQQLNQLYVQTAEQQRHKQQLSRDLVSLSEQNRELELNVYRLEQHKEEIDLSVRSLKVEKRQTETSLKSLQAELTQLQLKIAEKKKQKERLEEIINLLVTQLTQWHTEFTDIQNNHNHTVTTVPNLIISQPRKLLKGSEEQQEENLEEEWVEFVAQLTYPELEVLKAIVEQDNPNPTIKNIAESNVTMPELLIDAINERAIATIGDIIIETGSDSPVIAEEEYLTNIKKMLKIKDVN